MKSSLAFGIEMAGEHNYGIGRLANMTLGTGKELSKNGTIEQLKIACICRYLPAGRRKSGIFGIGLEIGKM